MLAAVQRDISFCAEGESSARGPRSGTTVIDVCNLVREHGTGKKAVRAVDGISFAVARGEVFGLLGPNGAGKTSAIEVLEGLEPPTGGEVRVLGLDITSNAAQIKQRIGVQLQTTGLPRFLTVVETVDLFASFYERSGRDRAHQQSRTKALLARVGLADKQDRLTSRLSGGERQRLALALALVNDPEVLFLDEPSSGLDPHARQDLWNIIREWQSGDRTVFLTTHDMREAESLCDRVAILDRGRIVTEGRVTELLRAQGHEQAIWVDMRGSPPPHDLVRMLPAPVRMAVQTSGVLLYSSDAAATMTALLDLRRNGHMHFEALELRPTTLEDVFLAVTGRRLQE